jgi:hypothetical protein
VYGIPYQTLADAPDGPNLGEDLALEVENELIRVDAELVRQAAMPQIFQVVASGNTDLTTAEVDIAGATKTLTTVKPNARYVAIGSFYFSMIAANNGVALGKLMVDGVLVASPLLNFTGLFSTPSREQLSQTWTGVLTAAGSHTLKLRAQGTAAVAAHRVNSASTTLTIMVFE